MLEQSLHSLHHSHVIPRITLRHELTMLVGHMIGEQFCSARALLEMYDMLGDVMDGVKIEGRLESLGICGFKHNLPW